MTTARQKAVILIIDGLGDLPVDCLDGQTPLEAARTPVLDAMAAAGCYGPVDPILPGEIPNTDSGVGLLLGLPLEQAGGLHRGPVEASGAGRRLQEGEVAVRANFATIEERSGGLWVTDRRAGRITAQVDTLAEAVDGIELGDGIRAEFRSTDQHRGVLILSGPGLDEAVSDTDPGDRGNPGFVLRSRPLRPTADLTANKINDFLREAHRRLVGHPVNRARRAAGKPAGCNTVLGLARLFDFDTVEDPAFTAALDTDLEGKVTAALASLQNHDMAYVHVKASDLCAHDRNPLAKRDFLERLDRALAPLAAAGVVVALSSDHTTDSNTGAHTADPVPSLIFDPLRPPAGPALTINFGETACREGTLPRLRSLEFLDRILAAMGC